MLNFVKENSESGTGIVCPGSAPLDAVRLQGLFD